MQGFSLSFQGYEGDLRKRQDEVRAKLLELIHYERTPSGKINVEISSEDELDGLKKRRYLVTRGEWEPQPIYEIFAPGRENGITLVTLHGHGDDPFTGIYDYVYGFARRGYRVVMPILYGKMERETKNLKPDWRDICREWSIEADALGVTLLAARLYDAHLAYDLSLELAGVDPKRIGCAGLSMGGELSLYLTATEPGIRACVSAGYLSTFAIFLLKMGGCQCYSICDWPRYFEMSDIAACVAPRPLQIQKGIDDPCFDPEDVEKAFRCLHDVYCRFGVPEACEYRTYSGSHCLNQDLADSWLRRHLNLKTRA